MRTAHHTSATRTTGCRCDLGRDASDPARRLSSHHTSQGRVVYFRCGCGAVHLNILRWAPNGR
jgi:hypothetical protein